MTESSVTAYRCGSDYCLDCPGEGVERVRILLEPGVRISRSGGGEVLLYLGQSPYGRRLADALRQGWCKVVSDEPSPD
jgi:hypothetical protein